MKTELEWVSVIDGFPDPEKNIFVIVEYEDVNRTIEPASFFNDEYESRFEVETFQYGNEHYRRSNFENNCNHVTRITHWAYVNLPEEEDIYFRQCNICKTKKEDGKFYMISNDPQNGNICKECKENQIEKEYYAGFSVGKDNGIACYECGQKLTEQSFEKKG